eukprot:m.183606 g.183606  ORF g.183606 m.183606 type:complete len:102 (+) comp15547_c0_seq1:3314-3619(+)
MEGSQGACLAFEKVFISEHFVERQAGFYGPKDGDLKYDLYGVARHHGSIWGGHYTAFCRDIKSNKWQEFDDERVRTISEEKAGSCKDAYILFYRRKEDTDC